MKTMHALFLVAVVAGTLVSGSSRAAATAVDMPSSKQTPRVTRVFYLQGMTSSEAMTLLRSQAQILQVATIRDRSVVIACDLAGKIDQAEQLLREKDAVLRVADPHAPLDFKRSEQEPPATRAFRVNTGDSSSVVTLLRAIYQMREVTELAQENSVSARAAAPLLDASEALLRELDLLVDEAKAPAGS